MATVTKTTTAEQLLAMPHGGLRWELIKGELHSMSPAGGEHGSTIMNLGGPLAVHVNKRKLGKVLGAETGFIISRDPDTVRAPDIAFIRRENIPVTGVARGFIPGTPDLAVEVISPNDTVYEVEEKTQAWLEAGTTEVWLVNPDRHTVIIHKAAGEVVALSESDTLEGGNIVPGFQMPVADIFQP